MEGAKEVIARRFSKLTVHWNHPESPKNRGCLGPTYLVWGAIWALEFWKGPQLI